MKSILTVLVVTCAMESWAISPPMLNPGGTWSTVSVPTGFPWTPPFSVQKKRRTFRADPTDPDSNPQTRAGITVINTYFVDSINGNDLNTGLSWAQAFRTLRTAQAEANPDRILIATNSYFYRNERNPWPARSMEIIGIGANITISSDFSNILTNGWVLSGSAYTQTLSAEVLQRVYDSANLDTNGYPTGLTEVGSVAACSAAANSFFVNFPVSIAVHTFNNRAPDSNLRFYEAVALQLSRDSITGYVENITFNAYPLIQSVTTTGNLRFYAKGCSFLGGFYAEGVSEVYLVNCNLRRHELNYHTINGNIGNIFELSVESSRNWGDGTTQASTGHDTNTVLSIGGLYHHSDGQNIADASGSRRWMLGSRVFNSVIAGVGVYTETTNWLDCVQSTGNFIDLQNTVGAKTWTRNFLGGGTNQINGSLSTY